MSSNIQATPAYELSVDLRHTKYGHHLRLISFVPRARRPEEQAKFQAVLSTQELEALRDAINDALSRASRNNESLEDDRPQKAPDENLRIPGRTVTVREKPADSTEFGVRRLPLRRSPAACWRRCRSASIRWRGGGF